MVSLILLPNTLIQRLKVNPNSRNNLVRHEKIPCSLFQQNYKNLFDFTEADLPAII